VRVRPRGEGFDSAKDCSILRHAKCRFAKDRLLVDCLSAIKYGTSELTIKRNYMQKDLQNFLSELSSVSKRFASHYGSYIRDFIGSLCPELRSFSPKKIMGLRDFVWVDLAA
jgi:hypothetical protein